MFRIAGMSTTAQRKRGTIKPCSILLEAEGPNVWGYLWSWIARLLVIWLVLATTLDGLNFFLKLREFFVSDCGRFRGGHLRLWFIVQRIRTGYRLPPTWLNLDDERFLLSARSFSSPSSSLSRSSNPTSARQDAKEALDTAARGQVKVAFKMMPLADVYDGMLNGTIAGS
ncbi:hypothetical protein D9757_007321 [Collybiopsis confluens]|uniref:Uncharacterized protein n=1 Tax=Collybiopsis confluens TaxID=2823264 RepID=A0A8H5HG87_9AGAR|nr:hypothetical protein D9757_007321 [Collybiopsis confluens]